jgi:hypothetical protein
MHANDRQLRGDATIEHLDAIDGVVAAWRVPKWDMTIRLVKRSSGYSVRASFGGESYDVEI